VNLPDDFTNHGHRELFDGELRSVKEGVVRMGGLVSDAIDAAVAALQSHDLAGARAVVAADCQINDAQAELTGLVVTTIATQAPVARDLHFLIALIHAAYELERIGDHAAGVARHAIKLGDATSPPGPGLSRMGTIVSGLLHRVLRALADMDQEAAREVAAGDDEVDQLYHAFFERVLEKMRSDPSWVAAGTQMLFAAKDLERIGDRITNIAEQVVFLRTGEVVDLNP
jgi:phosphate transport system protein